MSVNMLFFFFFQAEDGIRDYKVTGVQTCALAVGMEVHPPVAGARPHGQDDHGTVHMVGVPPLGQDFEQDRKSTRLNSSHLVISYAVFCLKKKTTVPTNC